MAFPSIDNLPRLISYWFKAYPDRKEDDYKAQTDLGFDEQLFILHVQCRWLTVIPALTRMIDNWEHIHSYFLKELQKLTRAERTEKVIEKRNLQKNL